MWKKPMTSVAHCRESTAHIMFRDTAERPYFLRNVIRKPKPMKIITWTSWNTDWERVKILEERNRTRREPSIFAR